MNSDEAKASLVRLYASVDQDYFPENVEHDFGVLIKFIEQQAELEKWINDLQSGMYINCVYCGHRYGPNDEVPSSMADTLKEHIEQCPKHPMNFLKQDYDLLVKNLEDTVELLKKVHDLLSSDALSHIPFKFLLMEEILKLDKLIS